MKMKELLFAVSVVICSANTMLFEVDCPTDCLCQDTAIHCERNALKDAIPPGLLEANLVDFEPESVEDVTPVHDSWNSISKLTITLKLSSRVMYLADRCFEGLTNLTFLGIHGIFLSENFNLSSETFFGLNNLETLDLSRNPFLSISKVTTTLTKNGLLPNLKVINLEHLQTFLYKHISLKEMNSFLEALRDRKIEKLIMDGTQFEIDFDYLGNLCQHLKVLSIKSTEVITVIRGKDFVCSSLKELDLTNASVPFYQNILTFPTKTFEDYLHTFYQYTTFIFGVETLNLNNFLSRGDRQLSFDNGIVADVKGIKFKVKKLNFRKNRMKNFNVSFLNIPFPEGTEIDVSNNVIEYIHPKSLVPGNTIRKLNLAGNKLYNMEKKTPAVFSVFLHIFTNLEEINLSNNKIKSLPQNMFGKNLFLKSLNVSGNIMHTLSFDISPHSNLQYLDISENHLTSLSSKNMADLENHASDLSMFAGNDSSAQNKSFVLYIFRNEFLCDCENLLFISWFKSAPFISEKHQQYCTLDDNDDKKYALKGNAMDEIAKECKLRTLKRNLIIGGSSSVFFILLTIFSIASFQRYRTKQNKIKSYLRSLRNKDEDHFLAFLSYCSEDTDFVKSHVANKLNVEICIKTKRKAEYICSGDQHFRPGVPILDEVNSKMKNSDVAIFVISEIFCGKNWCRTEVEQAMDLQKPIVLIFKEVVDERNMHTTIKELFEQNTRCKFVQDADGQWTPQPSWDVLTSSLIGLAAESRYKSLDK